MRYVGWFSQGAVVPALALLLFSASSWVHAAAPPNPYVLILNSGLATLPAPPNMPATVSSGWNIRGVAEDLVRRVWGITDSRSTLTGFQRETLQRDVEREIEYILSTAQNGRWWWENSNRDGDPNVDRFVLYSFLDALYRLSEAGLFADKMPTWLEKTRPAVEFQLAQYGQNTNRDWSTISAGAYPNMDAAYMLIMGLAGRLYGNPVYSASAHQFVLALEKHLLPDGGFNYISVSNEVHVYHNIVVNLLSRYYTVTGDELAKEVLAKTVNYYPLSLVPPGLPERTSHVWWKHSNPLSANAAGPEIIAGITGDGRNKWLAQKILPAISAGEAYYAVDYWRADVVAVAPDDRFIVFDRNINGVRGRFGDFSWVGTLGVSQDAFAGAMIAKESVTPPSLDSSLLLVTPEVGLGLVGPLMNRAAFITGLEYPKSVVVGDGLAALSVQYRPRRPANPPTENPEENWLVTQTWLFLPDRLVGAVQMMSLEEQRGRYVRVRVRTEPINQLVQLEASRFATGRLRLHLLENDFPVVHIAKAVAHDYNHESQPNADDLLLEEQPLNRPWRSYAKGQTYQVSLDVHPAWVGGVEDYTRVSSGSFTGFKVSAAGKRYLVLFNAADRPTDLLYRLTSADLPAPRQGDGYAYVSGSEKPMTVPISSQAAELRIEAVPAYGTVVVVI